MSLDFCNKHIQRKAAVACDDVFGCSVVLRRKGGAFTQKICGAGVLGTVACIVFRGKDSDGESLAELL